MPSNTVLQAANEFWVELARKPEGGSQNQVELFYNGHFFFYPNTPNPPMHVKRQLVFEDLAGNVYNDANRQVVFNGRPMRQKGNSMWRVYMPTSRMGFNGYQAGNALVRFRRTSTPDRYLIDVAATGSPQAIAWINASQGTSTYTGTPARQMGWS
jgi:hypothetical protein